MLGSAIIVFREVLEAALIIGLVLAATRGIAQRGRWVSGGLGIGLGIAVIFALLAEQISQLAAGMGQELLNALILFAAVFMLGWHNVWMKKHAKHLIQQMNTMGQAVNEGEEPLYMLAIIVGLAVSREGAEVVLFMHGMIAAGSQPMSMVVGALSGLGAGVIIGAALYFGLLRIPTRYLFQVTGIMILVLAAGLASQAAAYLVQADILPSLGNSIWDTSRILPEQSVLGNVLHTLIGYVANPMGIQIVFYAGTLIIIGSLVTLVNKPAKQHLGSSSVMAGIMIIFAMLLAGNTNDAQATHKVYSPNVVQGEVELEFRGDTTFDGNNNKNDKKKMIFEAGYGVTDWWSTAIFGEIEQEPGASKVNYEATAWENIFQLTEQGQYWLDAGLYLEYEVPRESGKNHKFEGKILLEKPVNNFVHTANLIFEHETGPGAMSETEFGYAWRSKWMLDKAFEPSIEVFGTFGDIGSFKSISKQDHRAGPVLTGSFTTGRKSKIKYEAGYLVGLTAAAPVGTAKWLLEYEMYF